jgi:hypothetical protein
MGLEINEGGIWIDSIFVSWDDILNAVVNTYPAGSLIDVKAARAIVEELRYLADDIEGEY